MDGPYSKDCTWILLKHPMRIALSQDEHASVSTGQGYKQKGLLRDKRITL